MPNFEELLSKPADEIVKPLPLPEGSYLGQTVKYEIREQATPKDTAAPVKAVCDLSVTLNQALDDVDAEDMAAFLENGQTIEGRSYKYTLWLTSDAQYRVIELADALGIKTSGKTLGEILPEFVGKDVMAAGTQVASNRNPDAKFFNIDTLSAPEA